jgi:hypothetical protein
LLEIKKALGYGVFCRKGWLASLTHLISFLKAAVDKALDSDYDPFDIGHARLAWNRMQTPYSNRDISFGHRAMVARGKQLSSSQAMLYHHCYLALHFLNGIKSDLLTSAPGDSGDYLFTLAMGRDTCLEA